MARLLTVAMLLVSVVARPSFAGDTTRPSELAMADLNGVLRRPLEAGRASAVVLLFVAVDCPISNGYAPEINRICKQYEDKGVTFYLVYPAADLTSANAKRHMADFALNCPAIIDAQHQLAKKVGATITPEAVVIGKDQAVLYRGRIDDHFISVGKSRYEATTHDLRVALDEVLAGKAVSVPRTKAIGCSIPE